MSDSYKVLAVNDDPDQLELLKEVLRQAGYQVLTAVNGKQGFELAQNEPPDLIISDVMMPGTDGFELCRLVRADEKLRALPILLVSAIRNDTFSMVKGITTGADDYMGVPYEPMHLIAKAARLIERKRMEDAFLASEKRFRSLIENSTDLISVLSPDGTIIYESPALENIFGYLPEELIGKNAFSLIHPDDLEKVTEYFSNAIVSSHPGQPVVYRFRHKDNSWRIVESVGKPFNDSVNGLVAIINSRDITKQQETIQARLESEERFKAQYKGNPIPTCTWKKVGDDFVIVDYNDAAEQFTNGVIKDYIGRTAGEIYSDQPELIAEFNRCFNERIILRKQAPFLYKTTDELKRLDLTYVFVPPDVVMVHYRDITEQLKAENLLRMSEERFRLAALATEDAIWDWDLINDSLWLSDAFYELLGYQPGEVEPNIGLWKNALHPEDKDRVADYLNKVIKKGERFWADEYRLCSTDGSYAHIFDRGYIVHDQDEKPVRMIGAAINFTERKQAELKLRFQKILLEAQSESSIDGILVVSPGGEVVSYNHRFIEIWEIPDESLKTNSDSEFLQSVLDKLSDPEEFLDLVSYLYENPTFKDQTEISLNDGRTIERYTSPVTDADGTHYGRVWYFRDITKRKQAEEMQRQHEEWLAAIFEASQDGIVVEESGKIVFVNKRYLRMYGFDNASEVIGSDGNDSQIPEYSKRMKEYGRRRMRGETAPSVYEFKGISKTGEILNLEASISTFTSNGKFYIVTAQKDITERKLAEKALAEANQRAIREYDRLLKRLTTLGQITGSARDLTTIFRAILDFSQTAVPCTGFFISLYDSQKKRRTPAFAWDISGQEFDVSNLPPMPMSESPHSRAVATGEIIIENDFQSAMLGQPVININLDKDPSLPKSCLVTPMAFMGRIVGAVEVQSTTLGAYTPDHATAMQMAANLAANAIENVRLLEQERERQEQLRQSQKLESVGRLAGGIAHDFNNMLTAINGYSELTLRRLKEDDPLRRNIEEIKKAGERSAALTHQLLAFSRKQILKPKVLNINEVITDISKLLQRLIGEDVELRIVAKPSIGQVEVDPGQLTQVIMNLAVNARDAMPRGGNLTIETSNVYLGEEYTALHYPTKPGSYVMLAVSDNGTGIEENVLQNIFEPFYTTKEIGKGTGLGLATVYGIIKQSNGYIWVYSEVGKGSTFKIYFPRLDEESASEEKSLEAEDIPVGSETILLVEDEEAVRALTRQILQSCGYKIIEAQNGVEALALCQNSEHQIDLLVTDVVMPKMGGRELGEKIALINPQIRQLYMSGYTDDAIIRQGMITEDMNFIQKPFTFDALAQKIRQVLDMEN